MRLERLVITSGSQQALHILSVMPFPNRKKNVFLEQPTTTLAYVTTLGIDLKNEGFRTFFQLFSSVKIKISEKRRKIKLRKDSQDKGCL